MSRSFWSAADIARVEALYPQRSTKALAKILGRSICSVYNAASKLGLHKSPEFLDSKESGRLHKGESRPGTEGTRFQKGQVPFNKGFRRPGWHKGRMQETQFKRGQRSGAAARNWVPIGTILSDHEGYRRIKVRDALHGKEATGFGNTKVWPLLNRYLWELHRGPIPPQHLVIFSDGDRAHCVIENLELLSMADNARRNGPLKRFPRELAEVIQLNGALKRKLRSRDGT